MGTGVVIPMWRGLQLSPTVPRRGARPPLDIAVTARRLRPVDQRRVKRLFDMWGSNWCPSSRAESPAGYGARRRARRTVAVCGDEFVHTSVTEAYRLWAVTRASTVVAPSPAPPDARSQCIPRPRTHARTLTFARVTAM